MASQSVSDSCGEVNKEWLKQQNNRNKTARTSTEKSTLQTLSPPLHTLYHSFLLVEETNLELKEITLHLAKNLWRWTGITRNRKVTVHIQKELEDTEFLSDEPWICSQMWVNC